MDHQLLVAKRVSHPLQLASEAKLREAQERNDISIRQPKEDHERTISKSRQKTRDVTIDFQPPRRSQGRAETALRAQLKSFRVQNQAENDQHRNRNSELEEIVMGVGATPAQNTEE